MKRDDFKKLFDSSILKELCPVVDVDNLFDEEIWLPAWGPNVRHNIPYNQSRTIYGGFKVAF